MSFFLLKRFRPNDPLFRHIMCLDFALMFSVPWIVVLSGVTTLDPFSHMVDRVAVAAFGGGLFYGSLYYVLRMLRNRWERLRNVSAPMMQNGMGRPALGQCGTAAGVDTPISFDETAKLCDRFQRMVCRISTLLFVGFLMPAREIIIG